MTVEDGFFQVAQGWQVLLRTLTAFFEHDWQVEIADDSILGKGANYYAILWPSIYPKTDVSADDARYDWNIITDLYSRYDNESDCTTRLLALRAAVIDLHQRYRVDLGGTKGVMGTTFDALDTIQYVMSEGQPNAGPVFKVQRHVLIASQYVTQTLV